MCTCTVNPCSNSSSLASSSATEQVRSVRSELYHKRGRYIAVGRSNIRPPLERSGVEEGVYKGRVAPQILFSPKILLKIRTL